MHLDIPYHLENFIGGNFIGPLSGQFIDNINPATGEAYSQIPDSNEKDIEVAVSMAQKAFADWKTKNPFISVNPEDNSGAVCNTEGVCN
ncbi:MAG: aldehyde dehydrogenase family protein [Sphingobacteriales bacterium]|nr:MAG: aldehyde dehydrogenase family protein [Sphingobacteriales bacterium]